MPLLMCKTCVIECLFSIGVEDKFFFGLATAPAHVEDKLDDAWVQFAEEMPCEKVEAQPVDALVGSAAGDGGSQPASSLQANKSLKRRKSVKVAMEAMIRGFEKYKEEEQENKPAPIDEHTHNVAAWHNVPNP